MLGAVSFVCSSKTVVNTKCFSCSHEQQNENSSVVTKSEGGKIIKSRKDPIETRIYSQ